MSDALVTQVYKTKLKSTAKGVILCLAHLAGDDGYCSPAKKTIAEMVGTSPRTVQRQMQVFEKMGLVGQVVPRKSHYTEAHQINLDILNDPNLAREYKVIHAQMLGSKKARVCKAQVCGVSRLHPLRKRPINDPLFSPSIHWSGGPSPDTVPIPEIRSIDPVSVHERSPGPEQLQGPRIERAGHYVTHSATMMTCILQTAGDRVLSHWPQHKVVSGGRIRCIQHSPDSEH